MFQFQTKYYFKIYLIFLYILICFFLYEKQGNNVEWTISEWLINYQGGFTRRGLIGEIILILSNTFEISLRKTIFFFQIFLYLIYFLLILNLIKNIKINILILFSIYCPMFLTYPVAETEVLGRKELFVFISYILIINLFTIKIQNYIKYFFFTTIVIFCILIWEGILFYILFFYLILFINQKRFNRSFIFFLIINLSVIGLTIYLIIVSKLSQEELEMMCKSLHHTYGCYSAIEYLDNSLGDNISEVISQFKLSYLIRYLIVILVSFFPIYLILKNSIFALNGFFYKKNILNLIFFLIILSSLPFYLVAIDWGRWINISYSMSILTILYLIKENYLVLEKVNIKKKLFVFTIFIIFAFGWSPKTTMMEDISSIPIYRKLVTVIENI